VSKYGWISFVSLVILASSSALGRAAELAVAGDKADKLLVYVGTYTQGLSKGIYLTRLDLSRGTLEPATVAAEVANPSFLAIAPEGKFLYAIGELNELGGKRGGAVSALATDPANGKLTLLNQQSTQGAGTCHLAIARDGKHVVVANYTGGSASCLSIEPNGRLGKVVCLVQHKGASINQRRQEGPHAHGVYLDAANRFLVVPDLGLDKLMIYRFDEATGMLTANDPPFLATAAGAGPRHFAFHPNGRYAYVINELNSTLSAMSYDAEHGVLHPLQTVSTLPPRFHGVNTCAEVQVHPSGKFVYGSNRGHNSIAIFAIDAGTGKLRYVGHEPTRGKEPRNFAIDPSGGYLLAANQSSDNVVVFRIDAGTGRLRATGSTAHVPMPVCVTMLSLPG
jgi:6-phosphogluconolactonase